MTRINKIIAKGFKSFGLKTELEFTSNFNCVLGPNGSGKSNIMDAICFVLGKGSAKGLRADKSANLIYNGGKSKNPAKEGEVSIFFDNSEKVFPIEEDYLKITRIIRQTGQSVYKINDKTRTRQEILDLLSVANIDPDGYNIVLQGDIVRLVEMSPVERRKIVEDIAGISVYEEKKNKALKELEKADEKINEAEIILAERESYLKELKKDRDQALKYKEIQDQLVRSKATLCHMKIKSRNEKKDSIDKTISKFEKDIKETQDKIDDLKKIVEEKKNEVTALSKEIEEKGEKDQVQIMKDIEQLKIDIATNTTRISSSDSELERVVARIDQLKNSLKDVDSKISDLDSQKGKLSKDKEQNDKVLSQIEEKIKNFKIKHKLDDSNEIEVDIDKIDKEIEEKQKDIQKLREEQQEVLREKDKSEIYINSFEDKIAKVKDLEAKYKDELEGLKNKRDEFKKTTLELNKLISDDSSLAAQLGNARGKLNDARDSLSKLNARNSAIKQKMQDSIATKTIMESKDRFGEVFGTISDLGEVESKYAQALGIAAGARIKSLVVDSDKTAASCIRHLKQNRLGSATFLPLNKIKSPEEPRGLSGFLKTAGVHGQAIDLITFNPSLKKAFSYVFGNTIVVDNIEVARRVGVGSIRMVTLDGDLVEMSGAMHGGYRQKQSGGGFQEKELTTDIRKQEKRVADNESLIANLEQKRVDSEDRIVRLREFKSTLEGEIIKIEKSLHLDSDDLGATFKEKEELEQKQKDLDKALMSINMKISSLNKELAQGKIKKQKLRDEIVKMKNPRVLAELNTFEQKRTELREQNIKTDSDVKNIDMQLSNILLPEKENISKVVSQHTKEEEKFRSDVAELKTKIKEQKVDLKEKEKKQKEFYGKYKELFTKKDKLTDEIQKKENSIIRLEEQARTFEHKMNVFSIDRAGILAELAGLNEENSKYKDISHIRGRLEEELKRDVYNLEKRMESAGNVNMRALEVYDQINEEYKGLLQKRDTLKGEKDEVLVMINEIETKKKDIFMTTFDKIDASFREMFKQLSWKGDAFLELENPESPFEGGMRIKVRISGKKFLDIRSLSGGEKTMTALAFIFSIQEFEPASFYVFDEVDAALDKKNSEMLADLVKKYSDKAQYIIISHKDGVISSAETLYGVSMNEHGISKVVTLKI